jgi:hypothetical protein
MAELQQIFTIYLDFKYNYLSLALVRVIVFYGQAFTVK